MSNTLRVSTPQTNLKKTIQKSNVMQESKMKGQIRISQSTLLDQQQNKNDEQKETHLSKVSSLNSESVPKENKQKVQKVEVRQLDQKKNITSSTKIQPSRPKTATSKVVTSPSISLSSQQKQKSTLIQNESQKEKKLSTITPQRPKTAQTVKSTLKTEPTREKPKQMNKADEKQQSNLQPKQTSKSKMNTLQNQKSLPLKKTIESNQSIPKKNKLDIKEDINEDIKEEESKYQLYIKSNKNRYQFFEVFSNNLIERILLYLKLEDLAKFATLSRVARNMIPSIIKLQDFSQIHQEYQQMQYTNLYHEAGKRLFEINQKYSYLIKFKMTELQQDLEDFYKKKIIKKDVLLDILASSVNYFMGTAKSINNVVDYILKKGIKTIFKALLKDEILLDKKLKVLDYPYDANQNTSINKLIFQICNYSNLSLNMKYSTQQQKLAVLFNKKLHYFAQFAKLKSKFIIAYQRPIYCVKRSTNIFDYLNKNIMQKILPFLNDQDISCLLPTGKQMNSSVKIGLNALIENLSNKRTQLLNDNNLNEQQADLVIYLKHKTILDFECGSLVSVHDFQIIPFRDMLLVLGKVIMKDSVNFESMLLNKSYSHYDCFYIHHSLDSLQSDKMHLIDDILQKYPDDFVEKGNLDARAVYYRKRIIALQKYLKAIRIYSDLKMNKNIIQPLIQTYMSSVFSIDRTISHYKRFSNQKTELLDVFFFNFNKPYHTHRTKNVPKNLFSGSYSLLQ